MTKGELKGKMKLQKRKMKSQAKQIERLRAAVKNQMEKCEKLKTRKENKDMKSTIESCIDNVKEKYSLDTFKRIFFEEQLT